MKDLKEAYADAVDLVEDFLDVETLEEYLFESLTQDGLVYWGQFENAISDASDNPLQEEDLFAHSHDIAIDAVGRLEKKYKLVEIDQIKNLEFDLKETMNDLLYVLGEIKEHGVMNELLDEFKDKYNLDE